MTIMQFIKGTFEQCEQYNTIVCAGEKYQGVTQRWADVIECDGYYAILYNRNYNTNLELTTEINPINL